METKLKVENLKCGGCAASIENALLLIIGVEKVTVNPESSEVSLVHSVATDMVYLRSELYRLGYPEAGTSHGLDMVVSNMKSYVSCAIGKVSKKRNKKAK